MMEIGRLCVKTCGRDAGQTCAIVEILDKRMVLIDGLTRRRKCNTAHLEPLERTIEIREGDSHEKVIQEMRKAGYEVKEKAIKETKDKKEKKEKGKRTQKPTKSKADAKKAKEEKKPKSRKEKKK